MIKGIGVDVIEISRIYSSLERFGDSFADKVFTDREREYCNGKTNPAQHFAARFAAKEALSKALHTGWAGDFQWKNVEVINSPSGKPDLVLHGKTAEALSGANVHLSLSHSDSTVVAFVIIEYPGS
jgi:holo-[acyl-carrier protein] synthase